MVDPSLDVAAPAQDTVYGLCEIGWLFSRVKTYIDRAASTTNTSTSAFNPNYGSAADAGAGRDGNRDGKIRNTGKTGNTGNTGSAVAPRGPRGVVVQAFSFALQAGKFN